MSTSPSLPFPSPLRSLLAIGASTLIMTMAGGIVAMAYSPIVVPLFGSYVRDPKVDGLNAPSLVVGYLIIALVLATLHRQVAPPTRAQSAWLGLVLGVAVFLGDHLVTAGWSTIPALPMLISGAVDPVASALGALVFSFIAIPKGARP